MGSTIIISLYHPLDNLKYRFMSKFTPNPQKSNIVKVMMVDSESII